MKKNNILCLSLILVLGITPTAFAEGLTTEHPNKESIEQYWQNYESAAISKKDYYGLPLTDGKNIYDIDPVLENDYNVGKLNQSSVDDSIHVINTIRYATGVKPVEEDKTMSDKAQHSAFINAKNANINHYPNVPQDMSENDPIYEIGYDASSYSNLDATFNFIEHTEKYIKDDLGEDNLNKVGHRAWTLSPAVEKIGIGAIDGIYIYPDGYKQTLNFQSMYVINDDYDEQETNDAVIAYPGEIAISEFNSDTTPYSILLGKNYDIDNAVVRVTDLNSNKIYEYYKSNGLNINKDEYGYMNSLVFGQELPYKEGTHLNIKVFNIKKDNIDYPIEFTSEFISLNPNQIENNTNLDNDKEKSEIKKDETDNQQSSIKDNKKSVNIENDRTKEIQTNNQDQTINKEIVKNPINEKETNILVRSFPSQNFKSNNNDEKVYLKSEDPNSYNQSNVTLYDIESENQINKDNLNKSIVKAEEIIRNSQGTKDQRDELQKAVDNAKSIRDKIDVTQEEINNEQTNIQNIINKILDTNKENKVSNDKVKTGITSLIGIGGILSLASLSYINNKKEGL